MNHYVIILTAVHDNIDASFYEGVKISNYDFLVISRDIIWIAQLAMVVEYTDCISAEG